MSWKYGGGNPEGTVAEIKTSGELAIETKGKEVKVNASEDNLAVHVARDGNDVVKRASALTKKVDVTENDESKATNEEADTSEQDTRQNGQDAHDEAEAEQEEPTPAAGDDNTTADAIEEPEDKMDVTPKDKKVEVGEKRSREDDDIGETHSEEEQAEKENGKTSKKTKLDNGDAAENGDAAGNDHAHSENGHAHTENGNGVEGPATEQGTQKKSKGPGRPKKADTEAKQAVAAEGDTSTIAKRTRSKA